MMPISLRNALAGLLALAAGVSAVSSSNTTAQPTTTSTTTQFSTFFSTVETIETTIPSPYYPAAPADICCFVVQDTVHENYWLQYTTTTQYQVVNLTSITTLVTPYPTITSTNYETNVYTTNATFFFSQSIDTNPIVLLINAAPGPAQSTSILNGTQVVTGGVTIASPAAFYVYTTVKIITAPAVTDSGGNVACATLSAFASVFSAVSYSTSYYIESVVKFFDTVVTTQYSTLNTSSFLTPTKTYTTVITTLYTVTGISDIPEGSYVFTQTDEPTFTYVNQYAEAYFGGMSTTPTGVVISLTTPFVYFPSRGAQGVASGTSNPCAQSPGGSVEFGYTPQTLVDFLAANAFYRSQYPGLASCLPGGPSVSKIGHCTQVSPESETAGGDLTYSTIITITPSEIKAPSIQPELTPESSAPPPIPPTSTTPISKPALGSSPAPDLSQPVASPSAPAPVASQESSAPTPTPSQPSSQPSIPQTGTSSVTNNPTSAQVPADSNIVAPVPVGSSNAKPQSLANSNGVVPVPASSSPPSQNPASERTTSAPGPAIASIIGAQPIIGGLAIGGGISQIIVSGVTTIPVNPALPLSGLTTVISGTTNVVVSGAATVPFNPATPLSGLTTVVSGTTNVIVSGTTTIPVYPALPLSGLTTVISGTTNVIVSVATTVSVSQAIQSLPGSTPLPSGTLNVVIPGGTTSSPAPIQASAASVIAIRWYNLGATVLFSTLVLL